MNIIKKIGFIGVGNMGNPMAGHLVKKGFDVTVYDIRPEVAQAFVAQHGGKAAKSLVDAAHGADAVITMLPDDKIVRKAVLGEGSENCVAAGLGRGAVVIDMSTCNPAATQSLAEALKPRGIDVVDAPVMGGVVFAKDATLDIMVGGEAALIERVRPVLAAIGRNIIACGGTGAAHAMKALANYINACALINAIEAMTIGRKFGLDAKLMAEALIPMCAGRNHPIEKKVIPAHTDAPVRHRHGDELYCQGRADRDGDRKVGERVRAARRARLGAVDGGGGKARRQSGPDPDRALLGRRHRRNAVIDRINRITRFSIEFINPSSILVFF